MYVELRNINKHFAGFQASKNVSFGIAQGILAALLGPSGSGKTTILRMIAGLETPDSGNIFIDHVRVNDLDPSKRGIGFVFQNYALFRYMTVFENIAFGLEIKKEKKSGIRERVMELLALIGMEDLEKRYPAQLSGGQKQRVAFARALAPNPRLLLLDEPFAAIDAKVRRELRCWLRDMIARLGITSIFVTHDQDEALEVAGEIILTNHGQVEQSGKPLQLYKSPKTSFVARFIGESVIVDDYGLLKGFSPAANAGQGHSASGAIRPEFIRIFTDKGSLRHENGTEDAVVESLAFRGSFIEAGLRLKNMLLTAHHSFEDAPIAVGDQVKVLIYRLYSFSGNQVKLVTNQYVMEHGNGYDYVI
ncbi:MAG: ABC transporter ATP-binding protein [Deltaproteobacteria bacterium]|jgi:sulfate transport system ATP-binding protein|nr:ABC transporter ATP-binding protein [Deltaproteobacteria bacterium]